MDITATVTLRIEDASGEAAEVTRTITRHAGDNPAFLRREAAAVIDYVDRRALDGLVASIAGAS